MTGAVASRQIKHMSAVCRSQSRGLVVAIAEIDQASFSVEPLFVNKPRLCMSVQKAVYALAMGQVELANLATKVDRSIKAIIDRVLTPGILDPRLPIG